AGRPVLEKSRKRRNIAGIARRRPGFVLALRPFARLTLYGLIALERGQTGECRLGMRAGRKLAQEIGELIQRGGGAERDPGQLLESRAREPLCHPSGEAGEMVAHIVRVLARLDEVPVGELLRLGDLVGRQPRHRGLPRLLSFRLGPLLGFALLLRLPARGVLLAPALFILERLLDRLDEALRLRLEPLVSETHCVAAGERPER